MNMGVSLFRGFVMDIFAAILFTWLSLKFTSISMKTSVMASLAVGLIGYLTISYLNSVWRETSSIPEIIDKLFHRGLVGVWLGWYLKR